MRLAIIILVLVVSGCAHTPSYDPADPLEPVNRGIYKFNSVADKYVLRPAAVGYEFIVPGFARTGVNNFFANLFYPVTILNQFLQGKVGDGFADLGRLVINTTLGIGGLIDVAGYWGLPRHHEDFGQTFGKWGVGQGWYLMLPLLGPSSNRDFVGMVADAPLSPLYHYEGSSEVLLGLSALDAVQSRAQLLAADKLLEDQLDVYVFIRSAYLQRRWASIHDGKPPSEDGKDDDFADFEQFDDAQPEAFESFDNVEFE